MPVVLLSGGMDSAVALALVRQKYRRDDVHTLSVDYGQRHAQELSSAVAISKAFRVRHRVASVRVDLAGELTSGTASEVAVRTGASPAMVPMRNAILLSMASGYAASVGASSVVIGACADDAVGFPDCRPEFLRAWATVAQLALNEQMSVIAPFVSMTKAQIVRLAFVTPGAWHALRLSRSCYLEAPAPCGSCSACVARARGFEEAKFADPALEAQ